MDGFIYGVKKMIPSVMIAMLAYTLLVCVYSNDGLGLRKEEYYSKKYQRIKDKIVKIIPDYSVVGVILQYDTNYMVVKSKTKGFFAHNPKGWLIEDNRFLNTKLTRFSLVFKEGMSRWLDSYTYREKHDFACSIFDLARKYKFKSLLDFKKRKLDFFRMVASSKNVDEKTKEIALSLLNINKVLLKSFNTKSLNEIAELLYKITNTYNNFYSNVRILTENDEKVRSSWLAITDIVYQNNLKLLNILGINVPERM